MVRHHPKAGNSGYEAGKGRTFTPSTSADWIEEFYALMIALGKSRNEMTEDLIRDGIKARKGNDSGLSNFYTESELDFLKNPVVQKLVHDYYALMNGSLPNSAFSDRPARIIPNEKLTVTGAVSVPENPTISTNQQVAQNPTKVSEQKLVETTEQQPPEDEEMDLLKKARGELNKMILKKNTP